MTLEKTSVLELMEQQLQVSPSKIKDLSASIHKDKLVELVLSADEARDQSYAPYSTYRVGAAILLPNGEIITGWNVENREYSASICAESSAIARLSLDQRDNVVGMAVVARTLPRPCGSCRQRMTELGYDFIVIIADDSGKLNIYSIKALLP